MTDVHRDGSKMNDFVKQLIKKGVSDYEAITELRRQYPSDEEFIGKMYDLYKERMDLIKEKAKKFKELIVLKYSTLTLPQLLEKAKKFQKKYAFSSDEFDTFIKFASTDKAYEPFASYNVPRGEMSKVLGFSELSAVFGNKLKVAPNELDVLQQILKINSESNALHNAVIMQSFQYEYPIKPADDNVKIGRINPFQFINPVLAALFLKKIKFVDEKILLSNISKIVKDKYEGKPIATKPDYELYVDLCRDPNDILAITKGVSPIVDLRNRANAQRYLWECVLNLRIGNVYNKCGQEFITELDKCGANVFDAPDLTFVRDEGTILRKLMGVFSLRPTITSVTPVYSQTTIGIGGVGMVGALDVGHLAPYRKITNIPMITVRLPLSEMSTNFKQISIDEDLLTSQQSYVENHLIVSKQQSVVFSRDLLIFYVNRRNYDVSLKAGFDHVLFTTLPLTVLGNEKLNATEISANDLIRVGNERFEFSSGVFVETANTNKGIESLNNVIMGTSAIFKIKDTSYLYNPRRKLRDTNDIMEPISEFGDDTLPKSIMQTTGSIFIYVKTD